MQMVLGFIFIFFSVLTSELGDTVLKYIKVHNKLETNIEIISAGETKQ